MIPGDEKKYPIPGEITYFYGSQIKNINIRSIEKNSLDQLITTEDIQLDDEALKAKIQETLATIKLQIK